MPLLGALSWGLLAMSMQSPACHGPVPDSALVRPGTLVMATNPTLRPLQFVDSSGALQGMRIELGAAIAKRLCLTPEYIRMEFSAMIPGLAIGRWDMINTGIFWTEQRAATMQMINYELQAISISVPRSNPLGIGKPDDLAGRSVGVEIGGFEESKLRQLNQSLVSRGLRPVGIRTFDNFAAAFQAMSAGQTDATVSIDPTAAEYAREGGVDRVVSGLYPTPVALAMKNRILSAAVVNVLNDMQRDGSYQALMARYGLVPHTGLFTVNGPDRKLPPEAPQAALASRWSWGGFLHYLVNGFLLMGALTTLWLTAAAIIGGLCLGSVLAWLRLARHRYLTLPAKIYIWFFRGTPLLVQLIMIYTGLPQIGIRFSVIESALIGLILNEGAYLAEIIRGGILAVPAAQRNAGRALGMNSTQVAMYVVLPQALRIIMPALGNSVNGMLKTTAITSVISMEELLRRTELLIQDRFLVLELFAVAALYYLLMTSAWDVVQHRIETRFGRAHRLVAIGEAH
jgi:polar amino acid transport system substrate-binding protein